MSILIIAAGKINNLQLFVTAANRLNVDLDIASFSDLKFTTSGSGIELTIKDKDPREYAVIYIRLIGRRLEDAALLVDYIKSTNVRLVDVNHLETSLMPLNLSKALETKKLAEDGIPIPKTIFAKLAWIEKNAGQILGFPYVLKQTDGKQANAVWSPKTHSELYELIKELKPLEKSGKRFLAQEFITASCRHRVLVIGGRAIAGITRGTRWRRRFVEKVNGEIPKRVSAALRPLPSEDARLAERAAKTVKIDIAGVDILREDKSGKQCVLEVNSAPRWYSVARDHPELNIEEEIVKYLASLTSE